MMIDRRKTRCGFGRLVFGFLLAAFVVVSPVFVARNVYAEPDTDNVTEVVDDTDTDGGSSGRGVNETEDTGGSSGRGVNETEDTGGSSGRGVDETESVDNSGSSNEESVSCEETFGWFQWLVCPSTEKAAEATDYIYDFMENSFGGVLSINPIRAEHDDPTFLVWTYVRSVANVVFIILLLIVIYSQITGIGISNYGIKKILPKMIMAAILMNLSYYICAIAVDVSNIIGSSIHDFLAGMPASMNIGGIDVNVTFQMVFEILGGVAVGGVVAYVAVSFGMLFFFVPMAISGLAAALSGLATLATRQVVVSLLIMVSPLAFALCMLPNLDDWFKKWKKMLIRMLTFYPLFAALFGVSNLVSWVIFVQALHTGSAFGLVLGLGVKVLPLFYSVSLMKMSGTFLSSVNSGIRGAFKPLVDASRGWALRRQENVAANHVTNGTSPSARLMRYLEQRRGYWEADTKAANDSTASIVKQYVMKRAADGITRDETQSAKDTAGKRRASRFVSNLRRAKSESLLADNAEEQAEHVLGHYREYFNKTKRDKALAQQATAAWDEHGVAFLQKEMDDEDDLQYLVDRILSANAQGPNSEDFRRFLMPISTGEDKKRHERVIGKVLNQAARVETQKRRDVHYMVAKWGLNGYNKAEWRNFIAGYKIDADGWALDKNGKRLKGDDGEYIELIPGEAITKAPEKLVLYDKMDETGETYFDFKDQDGNVITRIHHDNVAFIKETMAGFDIPIGDPINNVYGILAGIKPGTVKIKDENGNLVPNRIGLDKYSTTIGGALNTYKGNAAWSGAMFNAGVSNRQIRNAAQYAMWVLDSIKKTGKPGNLNMQAKPSIDFVATILNPDNWEKIFTKDVIMDAINIDNNEFLTGETFLRDDEGKLIPDGNGGVKYEPVQGREPTYEERMNTLKRKLLFPALRAYMPAFEELMNAETRNSQKSSASDATFDLWKTVQKWKDVEGFDPTLATKEPSVARAEYHAEKHRADGTKVYPADVPLVVTPGEALAALESIYVRSYSPEHLTSQIESYLDRFDKTGEGRSYFEGQLSIHPDATLEEMERWLAEIAAKLGE